VCAFRALFPGDCDVIIIVTLFIVVVVALVLQRRECALLDATIIIIIIIVIVVIIIFVVVVGCVRGDDGFVEGFLQWLWLWPRRCVHGVSWIVDSIVHAVARPRKRVGNSLDRVHPVESCRVWTSSVH
jgi:Mn2+/Fe2+ NRAMP family transporter